jgi:uncharacterized protein YcfL
MSPKIAIPMMLLAAALVAGCASKGKEEMPKSAFGCPMGSKGGTSMEDLIAAKVKSAGDVPDVKVSELRCKIQSDLMRIDATLENRSSKVRRISYRFEWVDEAGFKAWDDESWKPVMLYENTSQTLTATAPTRKAVDFRIVLLDQDKERK